MSRPRQHKRSPHPGVVLFKRRYPDGRAVWRARFRDPDTDLLKWETLEPALSSHEARRAWAIRKAQALSHRRAELATGAPRRTTTPLADALVGFFKSCKHRLRDTTVTGYRQSIEPFEFWATRSGIKHVEDITPALLAAYREAVIADGRRRPLKGLRGRGVRVRSAERRSPNTINTYLRAVKTLLNHWRVLGQVPRLSRDAISDALKALPVPRDQPEFLSPVDLAALLRAATSHDAETFEETRDEHAGLRTPGTTPRYTAIAPFAAFVALTGCRRGEALAIKWSDIDLAATDHEGRKVGEIRLRAADTKTKRARTIGLEVSPLLHKLLAAMKLRADRGAVYVFGGDEPLTSDAVESARARLIAEFDAPDFTWQGLRSTCATYLTNAPGIWGSATVFLSARQLGHSVAVAERHYLGVLRGISRDARSLEVAMGIEMQVRAIVETVSEGREPAHVWTA